MNLNRKLLNKRNREAIVGHFRLLGLRRGECRTKVIRSAAEAMAIAISDLPQATQVRVQDDRRAEIAYAAYKLLDPRERTDLFERVQLSYPIDRDEVDEFESAGGKLVDQMRQVVAAPAESPKRVKLMGLPVIHRAIGTSPGESPQDRTETPEFSDVVPEFSDVVPEFSDVVAEEEVATDTVASSDSLGLLEERRGIVRLLRKSDESTLRGLSTLGWLWSRLGM